LPYLGPTEKVGKNFKNRKMLIVRAPSPLERVGACPPMEDEVRMEAFDLICWVLKISSA